MCADGPDQQLSDALRRLEDPRVTRRRRLTLVAMCIAQGMTLLDVTIVNTALPSIQRELHMSAGQLEWVISAYALSLAAFIPLGGALGDRYGRKRFFLAGMIVFTVGSVPALCRPPTWRSSDPAPCRVRAGRSCRH
jgi:MFS family permease